MSEFKVEVVRIGPVRKHENADTLEITDIHGGYPVIFKMGTFKEGDLAVYVPVDALVPAGRQLPDGTLDPNPGPFDFLFGGRAKERIKAKRLRQVFSMGLLIPAPAGAVEGQDMQEYFGIEKYEPDVYNQQQQAKLNASDRLPDDPRIPVYTDVEGYRKWKNVLEPGELVSITEKVHGMNCRMAYLDGELKVGTHYTMKRRPGNPTRRDWMRYYTALALWAVIHYGSNALPSGLAEWLRSMKLLPRTPRRPARPRTIESDAFWQAAANDGLEEKLAKVPGYVVYGEVVPSQSGFDYGFTSPTFLAFDALDSRTRRYLSPGEFGGLVAVSGIRTVPAMYVGPWAPELTNNAGGKTFLDADHIREGWVVQPLTPRHHPRLGRVILKYVSEAYLLQKK